MSTFDVSVSLQRLLTIEHATDLTFTSVEELYRRSKAYSSSSAPVRRVCVPLSRGPVLCLHGIPLALFLSHGPAAGCSCSVDSGAGWFAISELVSYHCNTRSQRYALCVHEMGNAVATGVPTPNSPATLLRLRKGKKNVGCPCYLADEASTWESITENPKFRSYVLRHLLDEGFISSILEHGEREHALTACGGVPYYEVRLLYSYGSRL